MNEKTNCFKAGGFFRYGPHIYWLLQGRMASINETVTAKIPKRAIFAKTKTSKGNNAILPTTTVPEDPFLQQRGGGGRMWKPP